MLCKTRENNKNKDKLCIWKQKIEITRRNSIHIFSRCETNILRAFSFVLSDSTPSPPNSWTKTKKTLLPGLLSQTFMFHSIPEYYLYGCTKTTTTKKKSMWLCSAAHKEREKYKQQNGTKQRNQTEQISGRSLLELRMKWDVLCMRSILLLRFETYSLSSDRFQIDRITNKYAFNTHTHTQRRIHIQTSSWLEMLKYRTPLRCVNNRQKSVRMIMLKAKTNIAFCNKHSVP